MAKHKCYMATVRNTMRGFMMIEMDALEVAMAGNAVTLGDKTTYYFERSDKRDLFVREMKNCAAEVIHTEDAVIDDEC